MLTHDFPEGWVLQPVEDCMEAIIDYRGKTPRKTAFGIPLITAKVVSGGRIETPNEFIASTAYNTWMVRGLPKEGDVVMTTEAPLGEIAQLGPEQVALAQRIITLRGKLGLLDNTFLRYAMQSSFVQNQLASRASGTTVLGIKQSELRKIQIPIAPLDEQRRAGEILGALDDKIELNREMNGTLEAMARALFNRWFDSLSENGEYLTGADLEKSRTLAINDGYRAKRSELGPIGLPFVRAGNLQDTGVEIHDAEILSSDSVGRAGVKVSQPLDVAFTSKGTVGRMTLVPEDLHDLFVYSPQVCFWRVLNADDMSPHILYRWMKSDAFMDQVNMVKGESDMADYVSLREQRRMRITLPSCTAQLSLATQLADIDRQIDANNKQSRTLATTRDALLPELLSGRIRLRDAERIVEEVA